MILKNLTSMPDFLFVNGTSTCLPIIITTGIKDTASHMLTWFQSTLLSHQSLLPRPDSLPLLDSAKSHLYKLLILSLSDIKY